MIQEHISIGNKQNSFHDFQFVQMGNEINLSPGTYWRMNEALLEINEPSIIEISVTAEDTEYEVWASSGGILVFSSATNTPIAYEFNDFEPIDRLAWFTVPAGTDSLDNIPINILKIVEE